MTIPQLVGLLPIGALMGNELATLLIHRALFALDVDEHLAAEQAIHRVLGRVMPSYMIVAIVGAVVLAIVADDGTGLVLAGAAIASLVAMLAVTVLGNVPINNETVRQRRDADMQRWRARRIRWNRLHLGRVALDVVAFVLAGSSIVAGT
jgi:hypothetical protein